MLVLWLEILETFGWDTPISELTWSSTVPDARKGTIRVADQEIKRAARGDGFKALGTLIKFNGSHRKELVSRIHKLRCSFWSHKRVLLNRSVSFTKRLLFLDQLANAVLF